MEFINAYSDTIRAASYAQLEFPNTYYLAYRDLPEIISKYVKGTKAIDFGCGTGRSTRFLKNLGFDAVGVDISEEMVTKAKEFDPSGKYTVIEDGNFSSFDNQSFDLVLSIFTFDNIPGVERRTKLLKGLKGLLKPNGRVILLDATYELYCNEWASFSTKDFPANKTAKSGDKVYTIMKDVEDRRPVEDIIWTDSDYNCIFSKAGFELLEKYLPLGKKEEPFAWISETEIAPWVIYVLK
jgi:SAM-dependent methyltransferase